MSTRCNIIIRDAQKEVTVYRHCDGYPEGNGLDLINFIRHIRSKEPGITLTSNQFTQRLLYNWEGSSEFKLSPEGLHSDIEYLYVVILPSMSMSCYECDMDMDDAELKDIEKPCNLLLSYN